VYAIIQCLLSIVKLQTYESDSLSSHLYGKLKKKNDTEHNVLRKTKGQNFLFINQLKEVTLMVAFVHQQLYESSGILGTRKNTQARNFT